MEGRIRTLGVHMHGVTLNLESDNPQLIAYAREHLHALVGETVSSPDLLVRCGWSEGEWDTQANPFSSNGALDVIGHRMLGSSDELVWLDTLRMRGLQLRFRREGARFLFDVAYRFDPRKAATDTGSYGYKKFFSLMRYLVYHPLLWYLRTFRGWTALHASALDTPHGGIIIVGLAGVGKSTTCVALMQRTGAKIISENLILTDGTSIYPVSEPIRLDEASLALLGREVQGLAPMAFPNGVKEKLLFHPNTRELPVRVKPAALFLPKFARQRYLTELSPDLTARKIIAINALVRELNDYEWYAAALAYLWPEAGRATCGIEVLEQLTEQVRCYELGIDPAAGMEAVVEDIVGALTETRSVRRY